MPVSGVDSSANISIGLTLELRTIIPLIYRKGKLETGIAVSNLRATHVGDSLVVRARLQRQGTSAYLGTARGTLLDAQGNTVSTFERPIAIYYDAEPAFESPAPSAPAATSSGSSWSANAPTSPRTSCFARPRCATRWRSRCRDAGKRLPRPPAWPCWRSPPHRHSGPRAPAAEPVLIELQLGRIAGRTVEAYRAGDIALVPLGIFFELSEIRSALRPDGTLEAMIQPGNVRFVVDPATHSLRVGATKTDLAPDQLVQTATDVYLDTRVIGKAFDLEWDVSWPDLQMTVVDPGSLPVARRIRRDALVQAQLASSSPAAYVGQNLGLQRSRFDGVVFDYSLLTPTNNLAGAAYSGGAWPRRARRLARAGPREPERDGSTPRTLASWTGVWLQNPWLTQLRLGDAFAHRSAGALASRLFGDEQPLPPPVGDRQRPVRRPAGRGLDGPGLSRWSPHRLRLGECAWPVLVRRAGPVRREPGGLHRVRSVRRGAEVQPGVPGATNEHSGRPVRVRRVVRRLPAAPAARTETSTCATVSATGGRSGPAPNISRATAWVR